MTELRDGRSADLIPFGAVPEVMNSVDFVLVLRNFVCTCTERERE